MPDAVLINALQVLSLFGSFLTCLRLYKTGLFRRYRWFFSYFLFRIPNTIWTLLFPVNSTVYLILWVATEPITWIFHAAVLLELYRLVLEKYQGLYTLGRWSMLVGMTVSVGISLSSFILKMKSVAQSKTMFWYLALERGWMLALAIFLLCMMGFLALYTIPISRNIRTHARVYTVFFISNYLFFLLQSVFGMHSAFGIRAFYWTNVAAEAITTTCVFAWFFLLSTQGEEVTTSTPLMGPEQERRALQQLDAINATLLRVTQK